MDKMKRLAGKKILLVAVALCAFGFAKAQDTQAEKNILTLTLDKALEIALDENPTIKVAAEEVALKKVASKEAWFFVKFGGTSSIVNKESWLSVVCFLPYCTSAFLPL